MSLAIEFSTTTPFSAVPVRASDDLNENIKGRAIWANFHDKEHYKYYVQTPKGDYWAIEYLNDNWYQIHWDANVKMFGVRTEDFIPVRADAHPLSILILEKGKEKGAGLSKLPIEEVTKQLSGSFMTDDSDSTIEIQPKDREHYLPTSRASSQLQFADLTPFHTPIEPPASRVHFGETTMPSGGETFKKAAENARNQRIITELSSLNPNFIDYLVHATNQGAAGETAPAF